MLRSRRAAALWGLVAVVLTSCVDSEPVGPGARALPAPSASVLTGSNGVYILSPLFTGNQTLEGTFNPGLLPVWSVCELDDTNTSCVAGDPVAFFPEGSFTVSTDPEQYQLNWDTEGPETSTPLDPDKYYRGQVLIGGEVLASIDLDPQLPGPGQSECSLPTDCYPFQLGSVIPVKLWANTQVLCSTVDGITVLECTSSQLLAGEGGTLTLDQEGNQTVWELPPDALPPGYDNVLVVFERIGGECFPPAGLNVPEVGPCVDVTTYPHINEDLLLPYLITLCLNPLTDYGDLGLDQEDQLTTVKWNENGYEALENVTGRSCPDQVGGLLDVPEHGFFKYAALGINAAARFVSPRPLLAHGNLSFTSGGSTFSHMRFALLGGMRVVSGDGMTFQVGQDPADANVVISVKDFAGVPVDGARLDLSTSDGSTNVSTAVSNATGEASFTWHVDTGSAGQKSLTVSGIGLFEGAAPEHDTGFPFAEYSNSLTVTATVCEPGLGSPTVDGEFSQSEYACALEFPFTANLSGGNGTPGVVYVENDGDNIYFAVRVKRSSLDKINNVRIDFDNDGDGAAAEYDDAIGYDAGGQAFIDQYLTAKCVNSNQSGCGADDDHFDGDAAAKNDGTWTTTELSHPLTGGGIQDIATAASQHLGFTVTLSVGKNKGAQGNTQWPGFRDYQPYTVR